MTYIDLLLELIWMSLRASEFAIVPNHPLSQSLSSFKLLMDRNTLASALSLDLVEPPNNSLGGIIINFGENL